MTKHLVRFGFLAGLLLPAVALPSPIGPISRIVVTGTGIGTRNKNCAVFVLKNLKTLRDET